MLIPSRALLANESSTVGLQGSGGLGENLEINEDRRGACKEAYGGEAATGMLLLTVGDAKTTVGFLDNFLWTKGMS